MTVNRSHVLTHKLPVSVNCGSVGSLSVKEGGGGGGGRGEECSPVVRAVASAMVYRSSLHDFFFKFKCK